ncbi:DUF4105 domain-containing protein [Bacterioplanoides sp.]|uniref:Lnb N-terminal periplasmic domain-containing protein n=1 Tax=Bacterioplanoides sp. TaxID=2066072 RepID=UPI003B5B1361
MHQLTGSLLPLVCLALTLLSGDLYAVQVPEQRLQELAQDKQWRHLLHYRYHVFSAKNYSQNDDDEFFLSEHGQTDLYQEIRANYIAFKQAPLTDNQSSQCQFPARYYWLKSKLGKEHFVDQPCSRLDRWLEKINGHSLTLIFPASYINSPSSMYGHTLLRIDDKNPKKSKLLAPSVNFAARTNPDDNELLYTIKGLAGGYPGEISIAPYYTKTNGYQHMEYRDIWEYSLNFTEAEVQQFVRHVWEVKDSRFDYYFFDENCSYRLLALLDAASERADLADDFLLKAVPVDTVRALKEQRFISAKQFRPSASTELNHREQQASLPVWSAARNIVETDQNIDELLEPLTQIDRIHALELAYGYARYLAVKEKRSGVRMRQRTLRILSQRSRYQAESDFTPVPAPKLSDDEGHASQRLTVLAGQATTRSFVQLNWRIAFHDLLDLPDGFIRGSQIQMGKVGLRYWPDKSAVKLQEFQLIDLFSMGNKSVFQKPGAWAVSSGAERFLAPGSELYAYLKLAFGKSYQTEIGRFYVMAESQLLADNQFDEGFQLSVGPRAGWLIQHRDIQHQLELNWQPLTTHENVARREFSWQLGWRLADDKQIRAGFKRQLLKDQGNNETELSFVWYF